MDSTTSKRLQGLYFKWLCRQIDPEFGIDTIRTYRDLFRILHEKPFVWIIPNDDNRVADALDLRITFRNEKGLQDGDLPTSAEVPASVLEVLIGLSNRVAFAADGRPEFWAWQLIQNLELHKMRDPVTPRKAKEIDEKLEALIWRQYGRDGMGGFFPLAWPDPDKNQAEIELWYQMAAYVNEIHEW